MTASQQISHRQHHVPEFLMRPWAEDGVLSGYRWNPYRKTIECKRLGPKAFCYKIDAWMLDSHPLGRDALERLFFSPLDDEGAEARDILLDKGVQGLDVNYRCAFARLLLSLEVRKPQYIEQVYKLSNDFDEDAELLSALEQEGESGTPSEWWRANAGYSVRDKLMTNFVGFSDNSKIGKSLINMKWTVSRVSKDSDSLILSDQPLIRFGGLDDPDVKWLLPLDPRSIFCASKYPVRLQKKFTPRDVREINVASAKQAQAYVFSVDRRHERWLGKHLSRCTGGSVAQATAYPAAGRRRLNRPQPTPCPNLPEDPRAAA